MNRKESALKHHKLVLERDAEDTKNSVLNSGIYNHILPSFVFVEETDCVSAAINQYNLDKKEDEELIGSITILNFASYTSPGGGFINGAMAQEESLCHESNLYEILSDKKFEYFYEYNAKHKEFGLYQDRYIYTPNVKFIRDNKTYYFNVLTCAAPNYNTFVEKGFRKEEVTLAYIRRLLRIYNTLKEKNQHTLIAGAWGCGVFGFDRELSKEIFEYFADIVTILAIPK